MEVGFLVQMMLEAEVFDHNILNAKTGDIAFFCFGHLVTLITMRKLRMLLCDGYPLQQHNPANDSGVRHCSSVPWFHFPTMTCNAI